MLDATPHQVLAFRVAGHHLHRRTDARTAIAACGIQEAPPGWSPVALHARTKDPAPDDAVLVNAMRGAPYLVLREDLAVFTRALVPPPDGIKALVGTAVAKEVEAEGFTPADALERVADAARDALASGPLERDPFHQALRERLPDTLLPWCRGCASHHVRPGLWRSLGPLGVTVMPARATYALAPAAEGDLRAAQDELVRRFLRAYGPATHTHLASWAQTAPAHAKALFANVADELAAVRAGGKKAFVLAADEDRLATPPRARGIRLLGGYDPFAGQPDRSALAPDDALRKRMFPAVGRPGPVLVDGVLAGLWRARKKGDVLDVAVEWLGPPADIEAEVQAVARLRGCARARAA